MVVEMSNVSIKNCGTGILVNGDVDLKADRMSIENCEYAFVHNENTNLIELIESKIHSNDKSQLIDLLLSIKNSDNRGDAQSKYDRFVSLAANHMTLIAPFLPALAEMIAKMQ